MIALDTNILVRYLVNDDATQAAAAHALLEGLTEQRPGFVCREVTVELVWVLQRTYGLPRDRIARVLEELVATEGIEMEAGDDVVRAAHRYRLGGAGFSDLMIAAAAARRGAFPLYSFDRQVARLDGAALPGTPGLH